MLPTQSDLGNDGKDNDNGTNQKMENFVCKHTTENKNKQYSHGQVNQNSTGLLMDSGSLIMIVNNPKLLRKSLHPYDWTF